MGVAVTDGQRHKMVTPGLAVLMHLVAVTTPLFETL
jgi:hypothetical protein